MTVIRIRLVGEEDDCFFDGVEVDNQILYVDLKKQIELVTKIPPVFQKVEFRGGKLPFVERPLQTAQFGDELVVKHGELPRWILYRNCVEDVKKRRAPVVENAHRAIQYHQELMKSAFFDVYPEFDDYRRKNQPEVASWADGVFELMVDSAKKHFLIHHGQRGATSNAEFKFDWHTRPNDMRGTRNGIVAYVQLHGDDQSTKYSIKCHHYGSTAFSSKGSPPDIIELYSYKLLELLKVGPAVQFILPSECTGSETAMYIATTWRADFIRLSDVSDDELSIKALIQLRLLNVLFFIGDLHGDNCGQWKSTDNAAVVDLIPLPYVTHSNVKRAVRGLFKLDWSDAPRNLLLEYPEEKFWGVAKNCLTEWNALEKIKQANESIVTEKDQMKKLNIKFRGIDSISDYSVTNELDHYLEAIRANLEKLLNELGMSQ